MEDVNTNMMLNMEKNGINVKSYSNNHKMHGLEAIFDEVTFPLILKNEIEDDILNKNFTTYTFNSSGFTIINENTLELFCLSHDEDKEYRLKISVPAFWKAIYNYEKIMEKEWHKITITYDGNEVHFEVE